MQKQILQELRELRATISALIGTSELAPEARFSKVALEKAAKQFQRLQIERGEWVEDSDISKYIKSASYRCGAFIIKEFGFSNYFKRGRHYYYNRKDLIALGSSLKESNIDLGRYQEYIDDQARFQKALATAKENKKSIGKGKQFIIPEGLKDITTSPIPMPSADVIRGDLSRLKEEFFHYNLTEYVDIYRGNYAMMKYIYHYEKYITPEVKKRCKRWCENFNYANHALEGLTKKKEVFVPVKEDDMIQL